MSATLADLLTRLDQAIADGPDGAGALFTPDECRVLRERLAGAGAVEAARDGARGRRRGAGGGAGERDAGAVAGAASSGRGGAGGLDVCEHGGLRRKCETCELRARLAEVERERDEAMEQAALEERAAHAPSGEALRERDARVRREGLVAMLEAIGIRPNFIAAPIATVEEGAEHLRRLIDNLRQETEARVRREALEEAAVLCMERCRNKVTGALLARLLRGRALLDAPEKEADRG